MIAMMSFAMPKWQLWWLLREIDSGRPMTHPLAVSPSDPGLRDPTVRRMQEDLRTLVAYGLIEPQPSASGRCVITPNGRRATAALTAQGAGVLSLLDPGVPRPVPKPLEPIAEACVLAGLATSDGKAFRMTRAGAVALAASKMGGVA